jgi:H+/Cl- antiporter ClcA
MSIFRKFKGYLLSFSSHIRWGTFALLIAIFLFCVEIWLSLLQVYLSLYGGGVVVGNVAEITIIAGLIIFALGGLVVVALLIYAFFLWHRHRPSDETLKEIKTIKETLQEVKGEIRRERDERNKPE